MIWPPVLDEWETLAQIHAGRSLARYGNAEIDLLNGHAAYLEDPLPALVEELRAGLQQPPAQCLIGIPRLDPQSPKYAGYCRRAPALLPWLRQDIHYGSTFISRVDCAPWITTAAYLDAMETIWRGKKVALVCTPENPLCRCLGYSAQKVIFVACPARDAYRVIDDLERTVITSKVDRVILSCGATATCLAHRLARQGHEAVDVGAMGALVLSARMRHHQGTTLVALRHPHVANARALQDLLAGSGFSVDWMSSYGEDASTEPHPGVV